MKLNPKEEQQLHYLLDKACILWQYYDKEHVDYDESMSDDEWESFVREKQDAFASACEMALEDIK